METGKVHMEFHRGLNGTIAYLRKKYGDEFVDEIFRRMAHDVYRSIRQDLQGGDKKQLVKYWRYFFEREGGDFSIEESGDEVRFSVSRCPAISYLQKKGIEIDPAFCRQTVVINSALAEGSPFEIDTEVFGGGRCLQTIRRKS
jgi:hypothetical protein